MKTPKKEVSNKTTLKNYTQVFNCELSVNILADKLLAIMTPSDVKISDEDKEYFIRLTHSIVDKIMDNGDACADVFNTMNGWVKLPVPGEKEIFPLSAKEEEEYLHQAGLIDPDDDPLDHQDYL